MNKKRKTILIFSRYYLPAYKAGGPIQSIKKIVDSLGDAYDFKIICSDRDIGDPTPFPNINKNEWNRIGDTDILYIKPGVFKIFRLKKKLKKIDFDLYYLNVFFDLYFTVLPVVFKQLGIYPKKKILLAPRGVFSPGALNLKNIKKRIFIRTTFFLKIWRNIYWHFSSNMELKETEQACSKKIVKYFIAQNLSEETANEVSFPKKIKDSIKICYVGRINPKKNLVFAIEVLKEVASKVEFDIFGPAALPEEIEYLEKCKYEIKLLPNNIKINFCGTLVHDEAIKVYRNYHLFFSPTLGENFGHTIRESLCQGCPVLISDQTPWKNLEEKNFGWEYPLKDKQKFVSVIKMVSGMGQVEHDQYRQLLFKNVKICFKSQDELINSYKIMLDSLVDHKK